MLEQRFATDFFEQGRDEPGLVVGEDGVVSVVLPDGSRAPVVGGAGGGVLVQADDPGAVGAGRLWLEPPPQAVIDFVGVGGAAPIMRIRDESNTAWDRLTSMAYDPGPPELLAYIEARPQELILNVVDLTSSEQSSLVLSVGGGTCALNVTGGQGFGLQDSPLTKLAFWGADRDVQPSHIADPAGGAIQDAEARSAVGAILDVLQRTGLMAAS